MKAQNLIIAVKAYGAKPETEAKPWFSTIFFPHWHPTLSISNSTYGGCKPLGMFWNFVGMRRVINMMDGPSAVHGRVPIPLLNVLVDICISDRPVSTRILHHFIYKHKVYLPNFIYIVLSNATTTWIKGRNTYFPRIGLLLGKSHHNGYPLQDICHIQNTIPGLICICGHHSDPMNKYIPYVSTLL